MLRRPLISAPALVAALLALAAPAPARAQPVLDGDLILLTVAGSSVLIAGEAFFLIGDAVQLGRADVSVGWSAAEIVWGVQNMAIGIAFLPGAAPSDALFGMGLAGIASGALHLTHAIVRLVLHGQRPPPVTMDIGLRQGGGTVGVAGRW